ncbi:MAG: DNA repair protein RecN [Bacteroidales bacterium]|nr:DNA repair protein RecN [Bacteroidales bacterium]
MLRQLSIENYALIRSLQITFNEGFTAVTGETGAGKSIILGALGLLVGQRADTQVLQDKERKCVIEAVFDIGGLGLEKFFADNDLDYDTNVLIRREILPTAKTRAFINDTPVSLQIMRDFGNMVVDIHSQNQTLTLLNPDFQMRFVDTLADNEELLKKYESEYAVFQNVKSELARLREELQQSRRDKDYNQFLFDELEKAQLTENEQEELEQELNLLNNTETIKQTFGEILESADRQDDAAIPRLMSAKSQLSKITGYYPQAEELFQRLDSCVIELRDIFSEIENLDENLTYSFDRQQYVSQRLDLIYNLQSKHGVNSVGELLEIKSQLNDKLQSTNDLSEKIQALEQRLTATESHLHELANELSTRRHKAAQQLEQEVLPMLADLGMKDAQIKVQLSTCENFQPDGTDVITLLFNANIGGELREVGKVISGGELSRLMLAIKSLIVKAKMLPTLIFDEIDTGVSGTIAVQMANIMKRMSQNAQVLAITHLPQVAAKAECHYKVYKESDDTSTQTSMCRLTEEQRVEEIAKMLSSEKLTASAIETAKQLMN